MWVALSNRITVRRRTASVLDRVAAGQTMSWTRQPVREAVVEVRVVGGTAGTGQVTIAGTASGAAATETLVATGPGWYRTAHTWTTLAGLTTSGLADEASVPDIEARAVGQDGSPLEAPYTLVTGWPASVNPGLPTWPSGPGMGRFEAGLASMVIAYDETWAIREGDLVDSDLGETYEVVGTPRRPSPQHAPHWHVRCRRYEVEP